jgi:hypothetical protein
VPSGAARLAVGSVAMASGQIALHQTDVERVDLGPRTVGRVGLGTCTRASLATESAGKMDWWSSLACGWPQSACHGLPLPVPNLTTARPRHLGNCHRTLAWPGTGPGHGDSR